MDFSTISRKRTVSENTLKLVLAAALIGFLSTFLAITLKRMTEYYEQILFGRATDFPILTFLFPLVGLSMICLLRKYLFKGNENKGIREIFESLGAKSRQLPVYKIPSHWINGFLTVVFGGSTGIEVSTVVASAAIGSMAQQRQTLFRKYKTELMAAGVAAGITALFCSPIAGILFAVEVISKKTSRIFFLTGITSIGTTLGLLTILNEKPMLELRVTAWHYYAIPYLVMLGVLCAVHSVYLTRMVLYFKTLFAGINRIPHRILIGSSVLGLCLALIPALYGDGYHAIRGLLADVAPLTLTFRSGLFLIGILLLKPIVAAVTLAVGGDGGVFAPSLLMGAFLGWTAAVFANTYLGAGVIPANFAIIGMAAVLSASIHAPFTALFLVCGITNDYTLFVPMLGISLLSKYTAQIIYPFTVYTYQPGHIQ